MKITKLIRGQKVGVFAPNGTLLIVDIYPVGLLAEIQNSRRTKSWKFHFKALWRDIRARKWRVVKNHFNGYLAEPDIMPGKLRRCGSGWTRKRALRDLKRRVRKS